MSPPSKTRGQPGAHLGSVTRATLPLRGRRVASGLVHTQAQKQWVRSEGAASPRRFACAGRSPASLPPLAHAYTTYASRSVLAWGFPTPVKSSRLGWRILMGSCIDIRLPLANRLRFLKPNVAWARFGSLSGQWTSGESCCPSLALTPPEIDSRASESIRKQ